MIVAINASMRRNRRRFGLLLTTLALTAALVSAHGAMADDHMGGMAMGGMAMGGDPVEAVMAMCLAVAETGALALGAAAVAYGIWCLRKHYGRLAGPTLLQVASVAPSFQPRARAPDLAALQVLRI